MKQKEIKVQMVAPGEHPKEVVLKNDLDSLQKAVSIGCDYQGLIEVVALGKGLCIICNEEGKLLALRARDGLAVTFWQAFSMWWGRTDVVTLFLSQRSKVSITPSSFGNQSRFLQMGLL